MADPKLITRLEADIKKFEQQLDRADKLANKMTTNVERSFDKMSAGLVTRFTALGAALAAALSVGAVAGFAKRMIQAGDEIGDVADRLGISAEKLQEFHFAIKLSGAETEDFNRAMLAMKRAIADSDGEVTDTSRALHRLGINIEDLKGLSGDKILLRIAAGFKNLKNDTAETQIATTLFTDRLGQKMIPLLKQGEVGFQRFAAEARKAGLILSDETIKKLSAAADEQHKLELAMRAAGMGISAGLTPAMERLVGIVTSAEFQAGLKKIADAIVSLIEVVAKNPRAFAALSAGLAGIAVGRIAGPAGAIAGGLLAGAAAAKAMQTEMEEVDKDIEAAEASIKRMEGTIVRLLKNPHNMWESLTDVDMEMLKKQDQLNGLIEKRAALLKKQADAEKAAKEAAKPLPTTEVKEKPVAEDAFAQSFLDIQKATDDARLKAKLAGAEYAAWDEQTIALVMRHKEFADQVKLLGGDLSKYPEFIRAANAEFAKMTKLKELQDAGKQIGSTFGKAFEDMIFEAKSFNDAIRDLGKEIGKIIFRLLVVKNLEKALSTGFSSIGLPISGRQHGGPVSAGRAYVVGEAGPELFVPRAGGKIVPNAQAAAGSGTTIGGSTINVYGNVGDRELQAIRQALVNQERRIAATQKAMVSQQRLQQTGVM